MSDDPKSLWHEHTIDAGFFMSPKGAFLSISNDAADAKGLPNSRLVVYLFGNGALADKGLCTWKPVSLAKSAPVPTREVFALGEDGELLVITEASTTDRSLGRQAGGPTLRGPLRKIRAVGEHMLVVGMNHQVYSVGAEAPWRDLSPPLQAGPIGGFEAVAGAGPHDFVCAGWRGEIWRCREGAWQQVESPTELLITDIARGPDDSYIACGLGGLIVTGRGDEWCVIDAGRFTQDFHSVAVDGERVYLASRRGLHELRSGVLHDVSYGSVPQPTSAHTVQVLQPGTVGLIGGKSLYLCEGGVWRRFD